MAIYFSSSPSSPSCCSYRSLIAVPSASHKPYKISARSPSHPKTLAFLRLSKTNPNPRSSTRLHAAGFAEIEPDLPEGTFDPWATGGISAVSSIAPLQLKNFLLANFWFWFIYFWLSDELQEDFVYGEYDGHHTYNEGDEGTGIGNPTLLCSFCFL